MEVVFLHAPDFINLQEYYDSSLKITHHLLSVDSFYDKSPSAGIRVIINSIVSALKCYSNVAVLDSTLNSQKLQSYINSLKAKVQCDFSCISFMPKYGENQLNMQREFLRCEAVTISKLLSKQQSYQDLQCKEVKFTKVVFPLSLESCHQLEVPALFIEFSCVQNTDIEKICTALSRWSLFNPCGCIILLSSKAESLDFLSALCHGLDVPIFVCEGPCLDYDLPPSPGLVVLLIALLHLDIRDLNTCYLYSSADHRALAETAGIRHSNAAKIWKNNKLITSPSAFVNPEPNLILDNMLLKPVNRDPSDVCLGVTRSQNLVTKILYLTDTVKFHILAKSEACCRDVGRLYLEHATVISQTRSNVKDLGLKAKESFSLSTEASSDKKSSLSKLPAWMSNQSSSGQKAKLLDQKLDTKYILTESELLAVAQSILKVEVEPLGKSENLTYESVPEVACPPDRAVLESATNPESKSESDVLDFMMEGRKKAPKRQTNTDRPASKSRHVSTFSFLDDL